MADTKTKSGLLIPERAQLKVLEGTVVAVGKGARSSKGDLIPVSVQVGDKVLLPEYGGTKVSFEDKDKEYTLLRDADLLGKFE